MTDTNNIQPIPENTNQQVNPIPTPAQPVNPPVADKPKHLGLLLTSLVLVLLLIGGYIVLQRQTTNKLSKSGQEMKTTASPTTQTTFSQVASPSPREMIALSQPKAEQKASFYIKAEQNSYGIGDMFNLTVMVNGKGEQVDGAEFVLTYNPKLVTIDQPTLGTFFSVYPQKNVDAEQGTIRVIALQKPDESKKLTDEVVVTLPVTAVAEGVANFNFVKEKTHIAGYGGQELLEEAVPATITIK